jgi:hypothetical protein
MATTHRPTIGALAPLTSRRRAATGHAVSTAVAPGGTTDHDKRRFAINPTDMVGIRYRIGPVRPPLRTAANLERYGPETHLVDAAVGTVAGGAA